MNQIIINDHIIADPQICHGKPTFKGTRVMVWQVLELLANGENIKEILTAFPTLNNRHIQSALEYASSLTKENYVLVNTQPQVPA